MLIHLQVIPGLLTGLVRFIQLYYFIQILATSVFVIVTSLSRPVVPNLFCLKGHLFFYFLLYIFKILQEVEGHFLRPGGPLSEAWTVTFGPRATGWESLV